MKPMSFYRARLACWWIRFKNNFDWLPWRMWVVEYDGYHCCFKYREEAAYEYDGLVEDNPLASVSMYRQWFIPAKLPEFQGW